VDPHYKAVAPRGDLQAGLTGLGLGLRARVRFRVRFRVRVRLSLRLRLKVSDSDLLLKSWAQCAISINGKI